MQKDEESKLEAIGSDIDEDDDERCDLDPSKKCDNCCKCIGLNNDGSTEAYAEFDLVQLMKHDNSNETIVFSKRRRKPLK